MHAASIAACRRPSTASASPAMRSKRWTGRAHDAAGPAPAASPSSASATWARRWRAPRRRRLQLTGCDADDGGTRALRRERGAASVADVAAAFAGVRVVITMLPDDRAVAAVDVGWRRCARTSRRGAIVVDMSSSDPVGTRALGAELADARHRVSSTPRSRAASSAPSTARSRSWPAPTTRRRSMPSQPVLSTARGAVVFRTGPLGSGHAMKALNNFVGRRPRRRDRGAARREAFGLDPATMIDVLQRLDRRDNSTEIMVKQHVLSGATPPASRSASSPRTSASPRASPTRSGRGSAERSSARWDEAAPALGPPPTTPRPTRAGGPADSSITAPARSRKEFCRWDGSQARWR